MYQFYRHGNKVVCVSSFAGKKVKGVAKCDPTDEFDYEYGKSLAQARCDLKVGLKRFKRAMELYKEAAAEEAKAQKRRIAMTKYLVDASADIDAACACLREFDENAKEFKSLK